MDLYDTGKNGVDKGNRPYQEREVGGGSVELGRELRRSFGRVCGVLGPSVDNRCLNRVGTAGNLRTERANEYPGVNEKPL